MSDTPPAGRPSPDLRAIVRRARVEEADRAEAVAALRGAELARLELLRDAIEPVLAQIPGDVDTFDAGLVPGEHPRLFIDMIAFVEMAHDRRQYRFVQDTRHGRITLAETDRLDDMSDAVASYIARRLVRREKALASAEYEMLRPAVADPQPAETLVYRPVPDRPARGWPARVLLIALEYAGIVALCILAVVLLRYACVGWLGVRR